MFFVLLSEVVRWDLYAIEGFTNFSYFKFELEHTGSFKEEANKIVYIADSYRKNQ